MFCCTIKERSGTAWSVGSEYVKIQRTVGGGRNGSSPLYRREEKDTHTILICREAERLRERDRKKN
jgi:hypothetical protein